MRSVAEAARESGIPEETIRAWIDGGHLPAQQIGRTTLVNLLAVQSLGLRPPAERVPPDRDWSRYYRRNRSGLRLLGAANVLAGAAGLLVFAGLGPDDLRTGWWLLLCLGSLAVGVVEWYGLVHRRATWR
jgi:excisionase family DNA binding protein